MGIEDIPRTIWWEDGKVYLVDQSRLPLQGDLLACNTYEGLCHAIRGMAVRGAPALGVAAALGVALWATTEGASIDDTAEFLAALDRVADEIAGTRPTAVNLAWGAERMKRFAHAHAGRGVGASARDDPQEALDVRAEDEKRNRMIGANGAALLGPGSGCSPTATQARLRRRTTGRRWASSSRRMSRARSRAYGSTRRVRSYKALVLPHGSSACRDSVQAHRGQRGRQASCAQGWSTR